MAISLLRIQLLLRAATNGRSTEDRLHSSNRSSLAIHWCRSNVFEVVPTFLLGVEGADVPDGPPEHVYCFGTDSPQTEPSLTKTISIESEYRVASKAAESGAKLSDVG